jgi:hypothetical protein
MKAISVFPGKANSVHVADLPKPSVDQVPNGRGDWRRAERRRSGYRL